MPSRSPRLPVYRPRPATPGAARPAYAPADSGREYWRVDRVARYLDVSRKRIYQLVQEGRLRAIRMGPRQTRIERQSLEDYVARAAAAQTGCQAAP